MIKFLRGTTAKIAAYIGQAGELTVDTDRRALVVHDGLTAGGSCMATLAAVQQNAMIAATAGGTADAITAGYTPAITAPTIGMVLYVRAAAANTTPSPTFSPDGLTARAIVKGNNLPLVAGDIAGAGHWLALQYDASLLKWVLLNPLPIRPGNLMRAAGSAFKSNTFSTTSASFVDVPGLSVTVTPSAISSKFLVFLSLTAGMNGAAAGVGRLLRDVTPIAVGDAAAGYTSVSTASFYGGSTDVQNNETSSTMHLDAPATLSPITYKVQVASLQGLAIVVNGLGNDISGQVFSQRAASSLIVMEVL